MTARKQRSTAKAATQPRRSGRIRHKTSPYFAPKPASAKPKPAPRAMKADVKVESEDPSEVVRVHGLARQPNFYGLIQELVCPNVFRLLTATCLLNQTKGRAAMPVFWQKRT